MAQRIFYKENFTSKGYCLKSNLNHYGPKNILQEK